MEDPATGIYFSFRMNFVKSFVKYLCGLPNQFDIYHFRANSGKMGGGLDLGGPFVLG
jgi:hypothetical protein